jgi:outer membrane receptor for ferrienterochelin and colicins
MIRSLVGAILFSIILGGIAGAGTISGVVTNSSTGEAISGVNVVLRGTSRGVSTRPDGRFSFIDLSAGEYGLTFSCIGFQREQRNHIPVRADDTIRLEIRLQVAPVQGEPVVVTAGKREQSIEDVPVSIATMDGTTLDRRNIVTLDDALRHVPGVNMTDWQVNIRGSSGYSRGAGSRVLLLVDGIPFTTGDTGELNFESFPIGQIERVEVLKGAGSALYGSSAMGGVINIITKRIPEHPSTRIRLYGGFYSSPSFATWDWRGGTRAIDGQSFTHSFTAGDLGVLVSGSRSADDGYRQNDFRRRYNAYAKMQYKPSPFDDFSSTFGLLHQRRGSFLYWQDLQHALVPPAQQQGDIVTSDRFFWNGTYSRIISDRFVIVGRGMWYHNKWDDTIDTSSNASRSDVLRGEVQGIWSLSEEYLVTFGAEGSTDNVDADIFGVRHGSGGALYAQGELEFTPSLKATVGGRFDLQSLDSLETMKQFNPKFGLAYSPVGGTVLRASAGRGFRAPSVAEAFTIAEISGLKVYPNPALQPERSWTYEFGVNQSVAGIALLDLAFFRSDFDKLIEAAFTGADSAQFINVTNARIQGMEISAKCALPTINSVVEVGYTYVKPEDLTKNDILKYRPRHLLYANTTTSAGDFDLGVDFRYISKVERIDQEFVTLGIIRDGEVRVPAYVFDLRCGVHVNAGGVPVTAQVNVNNVFQYNYVELMGNLAPPRTMTLTLEATF